MCREVGIRQILVSQLASPAWSSIPLNRMLERAAEVAGHLRRDSIQTPPAMEHSPGNAYWHPDVTWEVNLLNSIGVLNITNGVVERADPDCSEDIAYFLGDLDADVRDTLLSYSRQPSCAS